MRGIIDFFQKRIGEDRYSSFQFNLRRARMPKSPDGYLFTAISSSIILGLSAALSTFLIIWHISGISAYVFLSLLLLPLSGYASYRIFLAYPSQVAKDRVKEIDVNLPHAAAFMLALSKGGVLPIEMFRSLGQRVDDYGEISKEAQAVVRNVEFLGMGPVQAIEDVAETTPSDKLREFLRPLATVIETGASISDFFSGRCEELYSDAKAERARSMEQIPLYAEAYVTAFGLIPFLAIVIWVSLSLLGGLPLAPMYLILFLFVLSGSAFFCIILDRFSVPGVKGRHHSSKTEKSIWGSNLAERKLLERLSDGGTLSQMKRGLASLRALERPADVLWVSVPSAMVFAAIMASLGLMDDTTIVLSFLICLLPFIFFHELRKRMVEKVINATPNFLTSLSASMASGLSPSSAIRVLRPERFGAFAPELRKMRRDLEWGSSFVQALSALERRLMNGLVTRVVSVMGKATESAQNVCDVLKVLATDVSNEISLKRERTRMTFPYVGVVYMVILVCLVTGVFMLGYILPFFPKEAITAWGFTVGGLDIGIVRPLIFYGLLIQGICMGLVAGKLRTGSVLDGVKHSIILAVLVWFVFSYFV